MTRLTALYENVQEAYGSEPEFEYTDPDRKNLIYTNMTCFPECKEFAKF